MLNSALYWFTGERQLCGLVLRHHLMTVVLHQAFCGEDGFPENCKSFGIGIDDLNTKLQSDTDFTSLAQVELSDHDVDGKFIDMRAFMNPAPYSVREVAPACRAYE